MSSSSDMGSHEHIVNFLEYSTDDLTLPRVQELGYIHIDTSASSRLNFCLRLILASPIQVKYLWSLVQPHNSLLFDC